jgi:hypothetical protein
MTTWRGQPTSAIGRSSASAPDVTSCRHADPLPWFENYPNGDLLAQARADFGGMLLTPETVAHERASGPEKPSEARERRALSERPTLGESGRFRALPHDALKVPATSSISANPASPPWSTATGWGLTDEFLAPCWSVRRRSTHERLTLCGN